MAYTLSWLDDDRLGRLIEAGRSLVSERDLERVLERLLAAARELTGARYAAIGVLDERREGLADFITDGLDPDAHAAITELPRGRGVLGVLLSLPAPLRIANVADDARSYGFPAGHPRMRSFLGTPILIGGEAWGNLYLADKQGKAEFDEADEESAVVLSTWAAIAVENARLNRQTEQHHAELQRSVRALQARARLARAVGGEARLERVLELIAAHARTLVKASAVAILLEDADELVVAAVAGGISNRIVGSRLPKVGSIGARVLASGRPVRVSDLSAQLRFGLRGLGAQMIAGIFAPLLFRGLEVGVIDAFDRIDGPQFRPDDESLLMAAATSAATAFATAQPAEQASLRQTLAAAEQERRRSASELHAQTLQTLGSLRLALAVAQRNGDLAVWQRTGAEAIEQIEREIASLRAIIADLRPPA